jgi:2',3'-cyclic-nucleotide 2'-phosphodiesterase (5'-nucleotidase family)
MKSRSLLCRLIWAILICAVPQLLIAEEKPSLQKLTVIFTNDVHGGIVPQKAEFLNPEFPPMLGGAPSAARLINDIRKSVTSEGGTTLLIDGGDTFQGTLVGTLSKGKAVIEYFNRIGYDAVVPGNHDFDLGKDNLAELIQMSTFPWVACNIYDQTTGKLWEWVKPWTIIEKDGLRIGITGAANVGTAVMSFPENIKNLEFRSEIPELQKAVNQLKAQNVDLVVALVHVGLPYDVKEGYHALKSQTYQNVLHDRSVDAMEIAHFVKGIDVLLGGHLHRGYREAWVDPVNHTICLQNYANGGNLGIINLFIDQPTKTIAGFNYAADRNALILLQQDQFWPDTTVAKFIAVQQQTYEKDFRDVIGVTRTSLTRSSVGEAPLNNLILDAMCQATKADFAFMNFGGIRADIKIGPITKEAVFKVLPFGNELVSFQVPGKFIKQILERKLSGNSRGLAIGGAKVVYNKNLPEGSRVVYMEINGEPLRADKLYRVATSDYLLEGNSGLLMLRRIPRGRVNFHGTLVREAVIEYIQQHSPLQITTDGRWRNDEKAQPDDAWLKEFK